MKPISRSSMRPVSDRRVISAAVRLTALTALIGASTHGLMQDGRTATDERRSPVQRGPRLGTVDRTPPLPGGNGNQSDGAGIAHYPEDMRTIDGHGNNADHPQWGAAGIMLRRMTAIGYADGVGSPAGADRPGARSVSQAVAAATEDRPNELGLSDYLWQWGQFLDHDITETPVTSPGESFNVPVPAGDPWFDPRGSGDVLIPMDRSAFLSDAGGTRQQLNNITAFIDASNVYGSEDHRTIELRTMDGTGRLRTSEGDLLPFNVNGLDNAPSAHDPSFFLAGDIRANEQVGLTALHVIFVREHNFWADVLAADDPALTGDEIFDRARAIVAAEMQAITVREFLPRLLGPNAMPSYDGYRSDVDPGITNVFATAAYRVGHTMLSPTLRRLNADWRASDAGHLALADAFFVPDEVVANGIDDILRGLAGQRAQTVDVQIIDAVRNFLFGPPGSGGFDLAALNLQRGRDHGLATYNQIRISVGRPPAMQWSHITSDPAVQQGLAAVYDHPSDVDAWIGLLAEPHRNGAVVGETLFRVLRRQFAQLRDGDRFWYRGYLPADMVQMVELQTLATIIRRNSGVGDELPDDVFVAREPAACLADVDGDGMTSFADLAAVLSAWGDCSDCAADVSGDGLVDLADVLMIIAGWGPC